MSAKKLYIAKTIIRVMSREDLAQAGSHFEGKGHCAYVPVYDNPQHAPQNHPGAEIEEITSETEDVNFTEETGKPVKIS